jgi:valyl-tRNA synthetase
VFPRADQQWVDKAAEAEMQLVQDVVVQCRMLRQTYGVPPAQPIAVELRVGSEAPKNILERYKDFLERMARLKVTFATTSAPQPPGSAKAIVGADVEIVMPLGGLIDVAAEKTRIQKDIGKADKEIATLEKKLGNADFLARAPEEVVAEQRARLAEEQARRQRLIDAVATLEKQS